MKEEIDKACQLMAIENLLTDLIGRFHLRAENPLASVEAHREKYRNKLSTVAMEGVGDAAVSELIIGGIGDHIDRLLAEATETVRVRLKSKP